MVNSEAQHTLPTAPTHSPNTQHSNQHHTLPTPPPGAVHVRGSHASIDEWGRMIAMIAMIGSASFRAHQFRNSSETGFKVQGSGFRVSGFGFRVWPLEVWHLAVWATHAHGLAQRARRRPVCIHTSCLDEEESDEKRPPHTKKKRAERATSQLKSMFTLR